MQRKPICQVEREKSNTEIDQKGKLCQARPRFPELHELTFKTERWLHGVAAQKFLRVLLQNHGCQFNHIQAVMAFPWAQPNGRNFHRQGHTELKHLAHKHLFLLAGCVRSTQSCKLCLPWLARGHCLGLYEGTVGSRRCSLCLPVQFTHPTAIKWIEKKRLWIPPAFMTQQIDTKQAALRCIEVCDHYGT